MLEGKKIVGIGMDEMGKKGLKMKIGIFFEEYEIFDEVRLILRKKKY